MIKRIREGHIVELVGDDTVVYCKNSDAVHLLSSVHSQIFWHCEELSLEEMAITVFPDLEKPKAIEKVAQSLLSLKEKGLVDLEDVQSDITRREFTKGLAAASALPAILTMMTPAPAAADSLGTTSLVFTGSQTVLTAPAIAMSFLYDVTGGSGGGGAGGGDSTSGAMAGMGAQGFAGETQSGTASVSPGDMIRLRVGGPGMGGTAGGDATMVGMTAFPGAAGMMGAAADNGNGGTANDAGQNGAMGSTNGAGNQAGGGAAAAEAPAEIVPFVTIPLQPTLP